MANKEEMAELVIVHKGVMETYGANQYAQGYNEGFKKGILCAVGIWGACFVIGYIIGMLIL